MEKVNGLGIASLVLGIVGLLLSCLGVGAVLGLIGLVLGILGLTILKNSKKGIAVAGTIVSGIALLIGVSLFVTGFASGLFAGLTGEGESLGGNDKLTASFENDSPVASTSTKLEGTYESNNAFEVIEKASFVNSIGTTYVVHKVKGKQNISASATMLAYDSAGNVIGKSEDKIVLTDGENNYFQFFFENDISSAKLDVSVNLEKDSFMTGERSAVVMENYNKADDYLYVTVKQVGDSLESFAKYKILLYKNGKIVGTEDGYFNVSAEGLTGKGTTDVIERWEYKTDYDKIEFIFEP